MIENIFAEKKLKGRKTNVNVSDDSWKIIAVRRRPSKSDPIGMMACTHKRFTITIRRTWDFANFRLRQFLN